MSVTLKILPKKQDQTLAIKPKTLVIKPQKQDNTQTKTQHVKQSDYSRFRDQRDHIYNIPDTYIGGSVQGERDERVLNLETGLFQKKTIFLPEGVERLFIEILSNAGDNSARSMFKGIDPGEICVTMTDTTIKIRNGGIPIPVEIHKEEGIYVPELIFGYLMSSSSYDKNKKRKFSSRNGFGAKLTNVFSKVFKVTVADPINGLLFEKEWRDNMKISDPCSLTDYSKDEKAFVEIEYTLDFQRFGYQDNKYPSEAFELFSRHIVDTAFTLKIPVSFNGKKFNIKSGKDYAKLYLGKEAVKNSILYYSWPEGTETIVKKGVEYAKNKGVLPIIEICAVDTPDMAERMAFVNNMWTRNGGVHYEAAFKAIASSVLKTVNEPKKAKKEIKTPKLTLQDVKKHVSLFVNCWIDDPIFDSQSKNELKSPAPKVNIPEEVLKPLMKWELVARLYAELDAKLFKSISKTDGKKKKNLSGMDKLQDANKAATSESTNCTLYVTEGDSALTFAIKLCSYLPNQAGRDYIGYYPLRGKPLNVMNAPFDQIMANKEINDLKTVLGLRERVDYTIDENYETLRYGHLMVCADADNDGLHILGLVLNLFYCKYPTLLARGYVKYLKTKILDVRKGKQMIKFYTHHEYNEWKKVTPDYQKWTHNYFKGLGTNENDDIKDESQSPNIVMTTFDEYAAQSFHLAFDKTLADSRKTWISSWVPDYQVETLKIKPLSSFINHEFIQFSIADVARSIPRFTDGLKTSQRKIMWTALKTWGKKGEKMKVAQFAASVSKKTCYLHGEKSLEGAIVGMAQDFVGANNMPPLEARGEFGTRTKLGADASAGRYIFTKTQFWIPYVFRKEDYPILNMIIDEGQEIEPVTLLPILPMHLINGQIGIGTGSSTWIPAHNPLNIVYWLESKILGLPLPELIPWYRGFTGEIEVKSHKKEKKVEDDEVEDDETPKNSSKSSTPKASSKESTPKSSSKETTPRTSSSNLDDENEDDEVDEDEVMTDKRTKLSMFTYGTFEEERKKITVTELPIGRSIHSYKVYLERLREQKIITQFKNYSTADVPKFEIYGMKNPSLRALKLIKSYGMSNMVLLDDRDAPVRYENAAAIMETFYSIRVAYYAKRKVFILEDISKDIAILNAKIRFILAVIKGYELIKANSSITDEEANVQEGILVVGRTKKDIGFQMEKMNFDDGLLKSVTLYQCTHEEVQKARDEIEKLENDRRVKEETTPEQMWLSELKEFVKVYCKHYKETYESPSSLRPE